MPTEELEQALIATKFKNAEKSMLEVIAKMLELPEAAVARVVFAYEAAQAWKFKDDYDGKHEDIWDGFQLDRALETAIEHNVRVGFHRVAVRWHIQHGKNVQVEYKKLVAADAPEGICTGCPKQFECVRDMMSTPDRCLDGKVTYEKLSVGHPKIFAQWSYTWAVPLKLAGNDLTVRCEHPRGTFKVHVADVRI